MGIQYLRANDIILYAVPLHQRVYASLYVTEEIELESKQNFTTEEHVRIHSLRSAAAPACVRISVINRRHQMGI